MGLFILGAPQGSWAANTTPATPAPPPITYQVGLTGYNAVPGQTDGDPDTTASGAFSNPEIVAARSVDLAQQLPFGTVIEITETQGSEPDCGFDAVGSQIGLRVIADSMNPKIHDRVDILFPTDDNVVVGSATRNAASALGLCRGTTVEVVGHISISQIPQTQEALAAMVGISPGDLASAQ